MKSKIVLGLAAFALVGSSLLACGGSCGSKGCCGGSKHKVMKKANSFELFKRNVMHLDLSQTQREKIIELIADAKSDRLDPFDALSDNSFDKERFIEIVNKNKENKVKKRAELMAQIHAVLTPEQKKQLKVVLGLKSVMLKEGSACKTKSCGSEKRSCGSEKRSCGSEKRSCGSEKRS